MLGNCLRINTVVEVMIRGGLQKTKSWHKGKTGPWTEPYAVVLTFQKWPRKIS